MMGDHTTVISGDMTTRGTFFQSERSNFHCRPIFLFVRRRLLRHSFLFLYCLLVLYWVFMIIFKFLSLTFFSEYYTKNVKNKHFSKTHLEKTIFQFFFRNNDKNSRTHTTTRTNKLTHTHTYTQTRACLVTKKTIQ